MSRRPGADVGETRAEVARRRLAQLDAAFRATADPPVAAEEGPAPADVGEPAPEPGPRPAPRGERRGPRRPTGPVLRPVHLRAVATLAVAAGVLLTWWVLAERPRVSDVVEPVGLPVESSSAPAEPGPGAPTAEESGGEVVVDVAGKVRRPGIVVLPAGSRVHEAIEQAGGLRGDVDTTALNLARVLTDGEQVLVGVTPAGPPAGAPGGSPGAAPGAAAGGPVNLNTATQDQLDTLPGVGPVTAESIITWRTENGRFGAVDDLLQVSGIGEKTLAELRDLVTV